MNGCGKWIGPFKCCTVVSGDSHSLLPRIPAASLDAVITDPPYGIGIAEWDSDVPYGLLSEFLRVTAGPILWFGSASRFVKDSRQFPVEPERVLIWAPAFSPHHSQANGFFYRYSPIYTWNLPRRQNGRMGPDVLRATTEIVGNWWTHPSSKPLCLMRDLCQIIPKGKTILDPFAGTGTTCVAARKNGQHFLGFEIEERHHRTAVERLRCAAYENSIQKKEAA